MNFQGILQQSTSVNVTVLVIDSSDHITGKTGATLTTYLTKAAGTPASISPTVTELDSTNVKGLYKIAFTTTHTNTLGELQLHITGTGCDPADYKWLVVTYDITAAQLPANATQINGVSTSPVTTIKAVQGLTTADVLSATGNTAIATAVFARAFSAAAGSYTFDQLLSLMAYALLAKCSGMGTTTGTFRNIADTADGITATIDANGNRSAVTLAP